MRIPFFSNIKNDIIICIPIMLRMNVAIDLLCTK